MGRKRRGKRPQAGYVSKPMMPYSAPVDDDTGLPHEPGDPSHMRCPHCGLWGRSDDFLTAAQLTNVEDVAPKHSPNAVKPSSGPAVIPTSSSGRPMDPYDPTSPVRRRALLESFDAAAREPAEPAGNWMGVDAADRAVEAADAEVAQVREWMARLPPPPPETAARSGRLSGRERRAWLADANARAALDAAERVAAQARSRRDALISALEEVAVEFALDPPDRTQPDGLDPAQRAMTRSSGLGAGTDVSGTFGTRER